MNITIDLATALVAGTAVAVGCWVYHRMTPVTEAVDTTSTKGERLAVAVTSAAAVIGIGAFLVGGITIADPASGSPAPGPTASSTGSVP